MSMNPLNDISAVYMQEVFKPQLGKSADKKDSADKGEKASADPGEASAKRIRQAVYDIRYRARREEIPVSSAYSQYMSHTTMTGPEKSEVKSKLGEEFVNEEAEEKKFQVRVTDKESGKSYVRMATREKINQLRANPNISSVEMTKYGKPYEGESKKGEQTAKVKSGKGLDPVGREDKDIDNDGDHDKTDKYLLNRRKVRGAAIANKNVKEGFSNWREDLREVVDDEIASEKKTEVKEKKVNNKITINPDLKESVFRIGGKIIDMVEIDENILDEISDAELSFLTDDLIEEVVEDFFHECLDEGYDIEDVEGILLESLDNSIDILNESMLMELNPYAPAGSKESKAYNKATTSSKRTAERTAKRAAKIQKIKDTVKKVGSSIKSAAKKAASGAKQLGKETIAAGKKDVKSAAHAAGKVAGKAVSAAKKVGSEIKKGYKAASSSDSESSDRKPQPYRYKSAKKMPSKPGLASRVGSALKKGLKKAVASGARSVARGARNLARAVSEQNIQEVSPPGFKGTVKAMKKHGEIDNAYALAWYMKKKGYKSHKKESGAPKNEEFEIEEGMSLKDYKKKRSALKQKDKRAADKIAPNRRKDIHTDRLSPERAARHRANVDPDFEGNDERNYPGGKLKNPKKIRKAKALGELGESILNELNRAEKETGINTKTGKPTAKGGAKDDKAFTHVKRMIRGMEGKPAGQRKKVPGKKPPTAGQYGAPASPAQKVAQRRAAAKRSQDNMSSRFD